MTQSIGGKSRGGKGKGKLSGRGGYQSAGVSGATPAAAHTVAVLTPHLALLCSVLLPDGSMKEQHKGRAGQGKSCYAHTCD